MLVPSLGIVAPNAKGNRPSVRWESNAVPLCLPGPFVRLTNLSITVRDSGLVLPLSPAFTPGVFEYTVNVPALRGRIRLLRVTAWFPTIPSAVTVVATRPSAHSTGESVPLSPTVLVSGTPLDVSLPATGSKTSVVTVGSSRDARYTIRIQHAQGNGVCAPGWIDDGHLATRAASLTIIATGSTLRTSELTTCL